MRNYFIQLERAANCLTQLKFATTFFAAFLLIGPSAAVLRGNSFSATAVGVADAVCFRSSYSDGGPGLFSASGRVTALPCNAFGVANSADSLSSADLASGELKAAAHSVGVPSLGGAGGIAEIMDTITFFSPGLPSFLGNATLSVNSTLTANFVPNPYCANRAFIEAEIQFGRLGDPFPTSSSVTLATPDCAGFGPPRGIITLITPPITIFDGEQWVIKSRLTASTTSTASADASNTAHLSLNLPPGVRYTSASGVLLTGNTPVPEPSSLLLLGTGFVGLLTRFNTWKKLIR